MYKGISHLVPHVSLPDPGTPSPTPILHDVTSGDIRDNGDFKTGSRSGDGDTHNVTVRWTLSEPDVCLNTIYFSVTPDDPTHCDSCEVGPGDPGIQEEFSCQVIQGIGQSCTYRVYADRCGNVTMSEPVEVNITSKQVLSTIRTFTSIGAPHLTFHYMYLHNCWAYCRLGLGLATRCIFLMLHSIPFHVPFHSMFHILHTTFAMFTQGHSAKVGD